MSCALSFHRWPGRRHADAVQNVYRMTIININTDNDNDNNNNTNNTNNANNMNNNRSITVVVAPVAASGRALAGERPTVAVTKVRIMACDGSSSKPL